MFKPDIEVLVIAHSIVEAFDILPMKERESFVERLRDIKKDAWLASRYYEEKIEERGKP